jgi:hypothetical protein
MKRAVPLDQYSHLYVRKTTPRLDWDWAGRHGGWLDVDDPARLWAGRSLCRRMADIEIAFRRNVYTSQRIQALKKITWASTTKSGPFVFASRTGFNVRVCNPKTAVHWASFSAGQTHLLAPPSARRRPWRRRGTAAPSCRWRWRTPRRRAAAACS